MIPFSKSHKSLQKFGYIENRGLFFSRQVITRQDLNKIRQIGTKRAKECFRAIEKSYGGL